MKNISYTRVACAIIEKEGKVLVTQRGGLMDRPGKWEFPGGKIMEGESEADCIKREIREELSIEVEPIEKLAPSVYKYDDNTICLIPMRCRIKSGEIKLKEHKSYKWVNLNELENLDWCAADVEVVRNYIELKRYE